MVQFICLFFPALVSVLIYEKLKKDAMTTRKYICMYALFNLGINFVCFFVKTLILRTGSILMNAAGDMTPDIALRYLVMAIPLGVIAPVVLALIGKHSDVHIEDVPDEE